MKIKLLFVDDEPNLLQGLQRMLRGMRQDWDMAFADSGAEALEILARRPMDVVVTDMRMPGMDGAQLLAEVQARYPHVVRIILSGQSDRSMIIKTVKPAHQFLAKPCDDATLKATIERARLLRGMLEDDSLRRLVSRIDTLPSLPSLYLEVMEELQKEDASIKRIGEIIARDIGMTAKILQLVNSAFFGFCRHVSSPAQAAELLGLETLKVLVLSVQIFSRFDRARLSGLDVHRLWTHSLAVANFARTIAVKERRGEAQVNDSFMAGVLHDVGKLVMAANLAEAYGEVMETAREQGLTVWEAERRVLQVTHAEMGAYLLTLWGLPHDIVQAVAFHHEPARQQPQEFNCLTVVHAANHLEHQSHEPKAGPAPSPVDLEYLTTLNLGDRLDRWEWFCQAG
ncbi:MAG: HDOD domain-containing protein [Deltaproteobacteria bacterium]|nr:HDOD domain-containing protein [Deltaproteobacteria bacterium]